MLGNLAPPQEPKGKEGEAQKPQPEPFESAMNLGRLDTMTNLNATFKPIEEYTDPTADKVGRLDDFMREEHRKEEYESAVKFGNMEKVQEIQDERTPDHHTVIGPTWYGWGFDSEQEKYQDKEPNMFKIDKSTPLGKAITGYGNWTEQNPVGKFLTSEETAEALETAATVVVLGSVAVSGLAMLSQHPSAQAMLQRVTNSPAWQRISQSLFGQNVSGSQMADIIRKAQPGGMEMYGRMNAKERAIFDAWQNATPYVSQAKALQYGVQITPQGNARIVLPEALRLPPPAADKILYFYSGFPIKPEPGDVQKYAQFGKIAQQMLGAQGLSALITQAQQYVSKADFIKNVQIGGDQKQAQGILGYVWNKAIVDKNLAEVAPTSKPTKMNIAESNQLMKGLEETKEAKSIHYQTVMWSDQKDYQARRIQALNEKGQPVGFIDFDIRRIGTDDVGATIPLIQVGQHFKKQGIGAKLVALAEQEMAQYKPKQATAQVVFADEFFEKQGYAPGEGKSYVKPFKQPEPKKQPKKMSETKWAMPAAIKGDKDLEGKFNEYVGSNFSFQIMGEKSNTKTRMEALSAAMLEKGLTPEQIKEVIAKADIQIQAITDQGIADRVSTMEGLEIETTRVGEGWEVGDYIDQLGTITKITDTAVSFINDEGQTSTLGRKPVPKKIAKMFKQPKESKGKLHDMTKEIGETPGAAAEASNLERVKKELNKGIPLKQGLTASINKDGRFVILNKKGKEHITGGKIQDWIKDPNKPLAEQIWAEYTAKGKHDDLADIVIEAGIKHLGEDAFETNETLSALPFGDQQDILTKAFKETGLEMDLTYKDGKLVSYVPLSKGSFARIMDWLDKFWTKRPGVSKFGIDEKTSPKAIDSIVDAAKDSFKAQKAVEGQEKDFNKAMGKKEAPNMWQVAPAVNPIEEYVLPTGQSGVFIDVKGRAVGAHGIDQHGNTLDKIAESMGAPVTEEDRPNFAMEIGLIYKASGGTEANYYVADKRIGTKEEVIAAVRTDVENTGYTGPIKVEYEGKTLDIKSNKDIDAYERTEVLLSHFEPTQTIYDDAGEASYLLGGYPEPLAGKGYTTKEIKAVSKNIKSGKQLTEKQTSIYEDMVELARASGIIEVSEGERALEEFVGGDFGSVLGDPVQSKAMKEYVETLPSSKFKKLYRIIAFDTKKKAVDFLMSLEDNIDKIKRTVMSFSAESPYGKGPMENISRDVASQFGEYEIVIELTGKGGKSVEGKDITKMYAGTLGGTRDKGLDVLITDSTKFELKSIKKDGDDVIVRIAAVDRAEEGAKIAAKTGKKLAKPLNKTQLKAAIKRETGLGQSSKDFLRLMKNRFASEIEAMKLTAEIDEKLARPLAASRTKPIVRQNTDATLSKQEPTITEKQALKIGLKKEAKAAKRAASDTKKKTKETMALLKKIKAKPIEAITYQARAEINELRKELKGTRTLEGLRDLNRRIQEAKERGKMSLEKRVAQKNELHEVQIELLKETIGTEPEKTTVPVTRATSKKQKKSVVKGLRLASLTPTRIFDMMDKGQNFSGPHNQVFYDSANYAVHKEFTEIAIRTESFQEFVKEVGLKMDYFVKTKEYDGAAFTKEEMIGVYNALKNKEKAMAMFYGNNISPNTAKKIVEDLSPIDKMIGDYIVGDYEQNYARVNEAFVEYTDGKHEMGQVESYSPIKRVSKTYEPTDQELAKEILERSGFKKMYAERGFTHDRKKIPQEYQTPIRLDEVSVFLETIQKQEHFISHGNLIKQMHRIIGNKEYREAVINNPKLGQPFIDELDKYVNRIANPNLYKSYDAITKAVTTLRGNLATVYLSWNIVTMGKQFPSIALYAGKVGEANLMGAFRDLSTNYADTIKFVQDKSSQMKNRQIERELEELKNTDPETYNRILTKVGKAGFQGIYMIDRYVTHGGWLAAYRQGLSKGLSDDAAARGADKIVLMTQPAAGPKDIPSMYATNEFLNTLLQFTNQLNKIYNNLTYDIPSAGRQGRYRDAMAGLLGVGVSSYLIWTMSHGRPPKTKEEIQHALTDSAVSSIPVAGPLYISQREGFTGGSPAMQAVSDPIKALIGEMKEYDDWEDEEKARQRTIQAAIKVVAIYKKIPYAQVKRTVSGIKGLMEGTTTDIRRLIWSEYNLKEEDFIVR